MEPFEQLQEHFSDIVTPVLDCFEDNYAERPPSHGRRPIFAHNLLTVKAVIMLNMMDLTTYSAFIRDEKFTTCLMLLSLFILSLLYEFRLRVHLYVSIVFAEMIMQRIPRDIGVILTRGIMSSGEIARGDNAWVISP